jgi:hypothetical protein
MKYHQSFLLFQVAVIITKSHRQEIFLSLYAILERTTELWQQRISQNLSNLKSTGIQLTQPIYFISVILWFF